MRILIIAATLLISSAGTAQPDAGSKRLEAVLVDEQRAALSAEARGDAAGALAAAERIEVLARASAARGPAYVQGLMLAVWQVRSQFLSPAAFLALPEPTSDQLLLHQIWRGLRIEAMARAGRTDEGEEELHLMRLEALRDKLDAAIPQLRIVQHVAVGRLEFAQKNYRGAAQRFQRAAEIERQAPAADPLWHQPLDAALGAALLKAGEPREARAAFVRALARRPDNLWALWGRAQADRALGATQAAADAEARVQKAWAGDRKWLSMDRL
ncbi:hypothetical protein HJG53_10130 [Sphingomonas sp. ID1715]|uniref:hypothetical protein n=1 Tax=Sphingomonas sp. ID1715 TaxID=1656898 RepID=UPI0014890229|nr:hypothetical protein [Sphingomonas sp. ID1715]NNM77261.1 hypothetical protein [Sphingomonas sp. ID1715]